MSQIKFVLLCLGRIRSDHLKTFGRTAGTDLYRLVLAWLYRGYGHLNVRKVLTHNRADRHINVRKVLTHNRANFASHNKDFSKFNS